MKVTISERALLARINRKLKKEMEVVRQCRQDSLSYSNLGDFYQLDLKANAVRATHIDIEKWGREMEVLKAHEKLEK